MATVPKRLVYSFEDFCTIVKEHEKADLIQGVIHMASPDNTDADDLFVWLIGLFSGFLELSGQGGRIFGSRVAFRLDDSNGPEPDLSYVSKKRLHLVKRGYVDGPPDLAMEIVSPESVERDYYKKRAQYEQAGVREYWIVDELKGKVVLLRLDRRGKFRPVRATKGVLRSQVLPGFSLRPAWLWQKPRPKKVEILGQMLSDQ